MPPKLPGQAPAAPEQPSALTGASADAVPPPQAAPARVADAPAPEGANAPQDDAAPLSAPTVTASLDAEVAQPARPGAPAAPDTAAAPVAGLPQTAAVTVADTAPERRAPDASDAAAAPLADTAPAAPSSAPNAVTAAESPDIAPGTPPSAPAQPAMSPATTVIATAAPDERPEGPAALRPDPAPPAALPDLGPAAAEAPPAPAMPAPSFSAPPPETAAAPAEDAAPAPLPQVATRSTGAAPQGDPELPPASALPGAPQRIRIGGNSMPGTRVGTLPRIGVAMTAEAPSPASNATAEAQGALGRNAIAFDAPEGDALLAVVLVHDGATASAAAAALPPEVTFAVSARLPGADRIAQAYRDAGHEVVLIADLPPRATPQDAEVALAAGLAAVPEAVALMDGTPGGVMAGHETAPTLVSTAAREGYGVVTFSRGFSAAEQLARNDGVPVAPVYRAIDRTTSSAASGALSQGAFRARQTGSALVAGHVTDTTVSALRDWLARGQDAVALAPLSAVLTGG